MSTMYHPYSSHSYPEDSVPPQHLLHGSFDPASPAPFYVQNQASQNLPSNNQAQQIATGGFDPQLWSHPQQYFPQNQGVPCSPYCQMMPPDPQLFTQYNAFYPLWGFPNAIPNPTQQFDRFSPPDSRQSPSSYSGNWNGTAFRRPHLAAGSDTSRTSSESPVTKDVKCIRLHGPPPKPQQTGHALWVGNLPAHTDISVLKDHFSAGAVETIESVFLISRSKTAFVNYKTDAALQRALLDLNNSKFAGHRLMCRLPRLRAKTQSPDIDSLAADMSSMTVEDPGGEASNGTESSARPETEEEHSSSATATERTKVKQRFLIMKSLTMEDLRVSVQDRQWVTQKHNEPILNDAFACADEVYLIFSVNKSGEYFGYARMLEPIDPNAIRIAPPTPPYSSNAHPVGSSPPKFIPTPATASAPKGYITDDSSRGTIFWESHFEESKVPPQLAAPDSESPATEHSFQSASPFKLEWISTNPVPFYRTRGLLNPWNMNRDVKVARDGTELEPNVARRLLGLFHSNASSI